MKVRLLCGLSIIMLAFSSCGEIKEDKEDDNAKKYEAEYESVAKEKEDIADKLSDTEKKYVKLKMNYDNLEKDYQDKETDYQDLKNSYEKLRTDYAEYKEKMQEFEKLNADEIEARKIAAAKVLAEEEERIRKEKEAEAKKKEEEEKKGYNTGITYKQLARTPDDFIGKKIKFSGKVAQVMDGDDETQIRLAVNESYDTVLYCGYDPKILDFRILQDDQITVYGEFRGLYSYQSTGAGVITIPCAWVEKIELKSSK